MNPFIRQLAAKRKKYLDGLDANEGEINLDIFEDFYPDQAHFIYELLQNAEDAHATTATFALTHGSCLFEHDGEPFTEDDVRRITGIHNSKKSKRPDQIGQFGIGFKSVFAYTLAPEVRSGAFAFRITRYVMPECIGDVPHLDTSTRFDLRFDNPKKHADEAYVEIEAVLNSLPDTTLLFLSSLKAVRWKIGDAISGEVTRIAFRKNHVEVRKRVNGETTASSRFLLFDEPVDGLETKRLAVAFALDFLPKVQSFNPKNSLTKQMRIVPANPGRVAVYFPAEKETSGLRFHLHAPFVPELSRASVKETPANDPLFDQLARLTAASLHKIHKLGLLNAEFLEVLPNPQDPLGDRYKCIREAIVDAMKNQPLTPTHCGGHAPAKRLLQARASLKKLLSEQPDIAFFAGSGKEAEEPPLWAIGVTQKNHRIDHFLNGLAIRDWDVPKFVERLGACTTGSRSETPNAQFDEWLGKKSFDWHQQLYALLSEHLARREHPRLEQVKLFRIVRLSDGGYSVGNHCFFPSDGVEHDKEMPRVARLVYSSGDNEGQQEAARKFLQNIDVREVGEAEQVEAVLQRRYRSDSLMPRKQDLKRFVALVENEPHTAALFAGYLIFEGKDGKWRRPSQVFLDAPFLDTGLSAYYQIFGNDAKRAALAPRYEKCGIPLEKLRRFARAVSVQEHLEIVKESCYQNPDWLYLCAVGGERWTNPINCDFVIPRLDSLLEHPSLAISLLVWRTLCSIPPYADEWHAKYQKNVANGARLADSQFVHLLRSSAWVPQTDGSFVRPSDASRALLPKGFPFDEGYEWLAKVRFGEASRQIAEERQTNEAAAQKMGFADAGSLERAKQFVTLPRDEQERVLAEIQRRRSQTLPEHEPRDPERRAERVRQKAAEAPERVAEERTRSVSVGRDDVKTDAEPYLREQYTIDGEMICQVCKEALPFKLDDGSWFFEKVEFLRVLRKRHYQNYLALCPNHAAMFQYANGSEDSMRLMFVRLEGNALAVNLAQHETTIYFTKTHIADLRAVIEAEQAD